MFNTQAAFQLWEEDIRWQLGELRHDDEKTHSAITKDDASFKIFCSQVYANIRDKVGKGFLEAIGEEFYHAKVASTSSSEASSPDTVETIRRQAEVMKISSDTLLEHFPASVVAAVSALEVNFIIIYFS